MVIIKKEFFLLSTERTSLVLRVNEVGKVVNEYYGKKINDEASLESLVRHYPYPMGCSVLYDDKKSPTLTLDALKSECSTPFKGDYNSPSLVLSSPKTALFDFTYLSYTLGKAQQAGPLPVPHGASEELILTLEDKASGCQLLLHYLVYSDSDVIGRYSEIINTGAEPLDIHKAMSYQICLPNHNDHLISLYGSWANEGNREDQIISHGRFLIEANSGSSSSRHNPFFLIYEKDATRNSGNAYGFNLVYSGNHQASVELDTNGLLHIQAGISPYMFSKSLAPKEHFYTPVGVLSYSPSGLEGVSLSMQHFVKGHIIAPEFANKTRPIVYNNWEATCWNFNKSKLLSLMKKASKLGVELFVLDDGWFSTRDDDSHGLGDWSTNLKKIPGGLASLCKSASKLGLKFGIWMEPEMVNADVKVYKEHPEWIIKDSLHTPCVGRHQYTLNLALKEVQDFVYDAVSGVLSSAPISYLKWDMNRPISDVSMVGGFSSFYYDYIVGLYAVLDRLVKKFPKVLFENCASGGNRFDLGMLSYFPQSWMSDDTDSYVRTLLQSSFALGYPLSVFSNHVAAKVSNQMLRQTSLDSKFDVASFGILGYELDLNDCTATDLKTMTSQITYYKKHRELLQLGDFYELQDFYHGNYASWEVSNGKEAVVSILEKTQTPNPEEPRLMAKGLAKEGLYHFETRQESISFKKFGAQINTATPVHINPNGNLLNTIDNHFDMKSEVDSGDTESDILSSGGVALSPEWCGLGYDGHTRLLGDFGGRLYYIHHKS